MSVPEAGRGLENNVLDLRQLLPAGQKKATNRAPLPSLSPATSCACGDRGGSGALASAGELGAVVMETIKIRLVPSR
eukprot:1189848-Prorocentrum_minimum.AAC.1